MPRGGSGLLAGSRGADLRAASSGDTQPRRAGRRRRGTLLVPGVLSFCVGPRSRSERDERGRRRALRPFVCLCVRGEMDLEGRKGDGPTLREDETG